MVCDGLDGRIARWTKTQSNFGKEYDSLSAFEAYKERRADYQGPYEEYKKNDPYYKDLFIHSSMRMEVWRDLERDLWIE